MGTVASDQVFAIDVTANGDTYLTGYTYGDLGASNLGDQDAFLTKYNAAGVLQWHAQLETASRDAAQAFQLMKAARIFFDKQHRW